MQQVLKQSTAATTIVGPILDSTGAVYTGAVIGDLNLTKNGTTAAMAAAATLTHDHNGHYLLLFTTGNTDTLGRLDVTCNKSTYAMPPKCFEVLAAAAFDTLVTNGTLASTTSGRTIVTDAAGLVDANAVKLGPTGAGTAQTARDIGASVLLSAGAGTGQLDFTAGVVKANTTQWLGTAASTPTVAGVPNVNAKTWNDLATVALPLVPTVAGRTLDVSVGGEAGLDWANVGSPTTANGLTGTTIATTQKVDVDTIKTNPVVNAGTVTFPTGATLASTTNITAGTVTTTTNLTNAPTSGDFTAAMKASIGTAVAASAVASVTAGVTVTTNNDKTGYGLSAAAVQAVWDALTSALTAAGSVGKKLADWVLGTDNRVKVSADVHTSGETVAAVTGNVGGNLTGTVGGMTPAALAQFFTLDSTKVYANAVAGSVVKEIVTNASGGSSLTAQNVRDAMKLAPTAGSAAAGSVDALLAALTPGSPIDIDVDITETEVEDS